MTTHNAQHSRQVRFPKWLQFIILLIVFSFIAWLVVPLALGTQSPLSSFFGGPQDGITIGLMNQPESLDIRTVDNPAADRILLGNVYEGLTGRNNDNSVVPGLASSWSVSSNGLTYTFHLRSAKFSNGSPVTAQDVSWSLQQLLEHKYPGYQNLDGLLSVTTPNSSTVVLQLSHPNQQLLWELSGLAGLVFNENSGDTGSNVIGTGPYTVQSVNSDSIVLTRNPYYWGSMPHFKTITLRYFANSAAETTALQSGSVNAAIDVDASDMNLLKSNSKFKVTVGASTTVATLMFNSHVTSLMSDYQAREAMRLMINRQQVIQAAGGLGIPLGGPIPSLDPGYEDLTSAFPNNEQLGKEKFEYYFTRSYTLAYTNEVPEAVANSIVSQIKNVGWTVTAYKISQSQWNSEVVNNMKYDMVLFMNHGSHNLGYWTTGTNWWNFDSPVADQEYRDAIQSTTYEGYITNLQKAARTLASKQPADWLYEVQVANAWDSSLSGMPTNMTDDWLPLGTLK